MPPTLFLLDLFGSSAMPPSLLAVSGVALAGFVFGICRGRLLSLGLFGASDSESIMNFSSLGTLRCVCGAAHKAGLSPNRRRFCRLCGCEVIEQDKALLERRLTSRDIERLVRQLRRAARCVRKLELPPSVTDIEALHRFLAFDYEMPSRNPSPQAAVGQAEVH